MQLYLIFQQNGQSALQHYQQLLPEFSLEHCHIENEQLIEATFSIGNQHFFAMDSSYNLSNTTTIKLTVKSRQLFEHIIHHLSQTMLIEPKPTAYYQSFTWFIDLYGIDWHLSLA